MKAHVLQHVPFEGLGSIQSWLISHCATVTFTRFYESAQLPRLADFDLVIAMGGPMSVNDEATLPWLKEEKRFISSAVRVNQPVIGICLGAQLIASSLGARVYPGQHKEIGWFNIEATPTGPDLFKFPEAESVFHWHGETFDLPPGATRLARSIACENQAFQIGTSVIGLQFHLETTPNSADSIISHCKHELVEGAFIRPEAEMRKVPAASYVRINQLMAEVLTFVTRTTKD
jgi:GMP synthase-like glutamine amidotransferase